MSQSYLEELFSLKGRTALVTGAAKGNGAAMAEALGLAGAEVVLVDVLSRKLDETLKRLKNKGIRCWRIQADITQKSGIRQIVDRLKGLKPNYFILVNNAGITKSENINTYKEKNWNLTLKVNLHAPFFLSQALAKNYMIPHKRGVIINITSLNAVLAFPDNPAYVASKGGLKSLTQSLALDLGKYGIRVNAIAPGYIVTDMTKKSFSEKHLREKRKNRTILGRWGFPEDLAGAIIFLCSDASRYVTGDSLYIDGGWKIKGL